MIFQLSCNLSGQYQWCRGGREIHMFTNTVDYDGYIMFVKEVL